MVARGAWWRFWIGRGPSCLWSVRLRLGSLGRVEADYPWVFLVDRAKAGNPVSVFWRCSIGRGGIPSTKRGRDRDEVQQRRTANVFFLFVLRLFVLVATEGEL